MLREQTAECHWRRGLKRRVLRAVRKWARAEAEERRLEEESERRKKAIDGYFEGLKERARGEEERIKREKLERL